MRRTALRGHALQYEGRAVVRDADEFPRYLRLTYTGNGVAYCECGEASPELPSTAARQRWHRDVHKPAMLAAAMVKNNRDLDYLQATLICDCAHEWGEHASGPDDDTTECMHEGCECQTFVVGDEVRAQDDG